MTPTPRRDKGDGSIFQARERDPKTGEWRLSSVWTIR
jgi:hypothetical protein